MRPLLVSSLLVFNKGERRRIKPKVCQQQKQRLLEARRSRTAPESDNDDALALFLLCFPTR
jgi:hypothetical protein